MMDGKSGAEQQSKHVQGEPWIIPMKNHALSHSDIFGTNLPAHADKNLSLKK